MSQIQLPDLPPPQLVPVSASGQFMVGQNFSDLGEALASLGAAARSSFRLSTARTLGRRNVAAERQRLVELDFTNQASELLRQRQEIERASRFTRQKGEVALRESQVEVAAQQLLTDEAQQQVVESQIESAEARNKYSEMSQKEMNHLMGWLAFADPRDAIKAFNEWKFLHPQNRETISRVLASKIARTHMAEITLAHREQPLNEEFSFKDAANEKIEGMIATGMPQEILGPYVDQLSRSVIDAQDDQGRRLGRNTQQEQENDALDARNTAVTNYMASGGEQSAMDTLIERVADVGRMRLGLEDEALEKYVEEHMPGVLMDSFRRMIGDTNRDPDMLVRGLPASPDGSPDSEAVDMPGAAKFWAENGNEVEALVTNAKKQFSDKKDDEIFRRVNHAMRAGLFAAAMEEAGGIEAEFLRARAFAAVRAAKTEEERYEPAATLMNLAFMGDFTIKDTFAPTQAQTKRWYKENVANGRVPIGKYIAATLTHGWSISPDAAADIKVSLDSGNYALVGRQMMQALAVAPSKTKNWLERIEGGQHLIDALVSNNEMVPGDPNWEAGMDKIDDTRLPMWRKAADEARVDLDIPPMRVNGEEMKGVFRGAAAEEWNHIYFYEYKRLAKEARLTPEETPAAAAQLASDKMDGRVLRIKDPESPSGWSFVPERTYGLGDVNSNQGEQVGRLELQVQLATQILDSRKLGGFLGIGDDDTVWFDESKGIRNFDGTVTIPGFTHSGGSRAQVWYNFDPKLDPSIGAQQMIGRSFMGGTMLQEVGEGNITDAAREEIEKRLIFPDSGAQAAQLAEKIRTGGVAEDLVEEEKARALKLQSNAEKIQFLEFELGNRYEHSELSKDSLWRYNPAIAGGREITVEEYNKRNSTPFAPYNLHQAAAEFAIRNMSEGKDFDSQPIEWQVNKINEALHRLRFPQSMWVDKNALEEDEFFAQIGTGPLVTQ